MIPSTPTSRLPVELWQKILRFVILGLYILKLDPYDVPSSLFLNIPFHTNIPKKSYKDYITQVENIRRVCKSWNSFSISLLDVVVSLRGDHPQNTTNAEVKRLSHAINLTQRSLPPICGCRFGTACATCKVPACPNLKQIQGPFRAQIMDVMDDDILQYLLNSPERFPNLASVNLAGAIPFFRPCLPIFFARFSSLILLRIWIYGYGDLNIPLDLPNLRSLEISARVTPTLLGWKLPSLRCFRYEGGNSSIKYLIDSLKDIAPNVTFLSLPYQSFFYSDHLPDIWEILPNLIILSCPIEFLLANPPPPSHPLQQFRMIETYEHLECVQQEQLLKLMDVGSNLHSIMGKFDWSKDFERVMGSIWDEEPLYTDFECKSRLRLGLELKSLGAKYQDMYGLSFTEACDQFGGASPLLSIQEYVSAVTAREQSSSPSDSS